MTPRRIAARAAIQYLEAGTTVIHKDVILGPSLAHIPQLYRGYPLSIVVLCPRPPVVTARDPARYKQVYHDRREVEAFDALLRARTPGSVTGSTTPTSPSPKPLPRCSLTYPRHRHNPERAPHTL